MRLKVSVQGKQYIVLPGVGMMIAYAPVD